MLNLPIFYEHLPFFYGSFHPSKILPTIIQIKNLIKTPKLFFYILVHKIIN